MNVDVNLNRRQLIAGAAASAVAGTLAAETPPGQEAAATMITSADLPRPADSGIDHIVVVMMENRSFDHYLGWLPGADGRQAGMSYRNPRGDRRFTHHLTTFTGCGHPIRTIPGKAAARS